jgi:hypothetical protein
MHPRLSLLTAALGLAAAGCASFAPNVDGMYAGVASAPRAAAPPALVLVGDIGIRRGDDTVRIADRIARELDRSPEAPVIVLGDVFYVIGLRGECPSTPGVSMFRCEDDAGPPEDQLESVLGPYRDALDGHPLIAIGGNHDYYGGEQAVRNQCQLIPQAGNGWRYYAKGCELSSERPVATIDLGEVVVFAVDSEPMIRDRKYRKRSVEALRHELERVAAEKPDAWRLVATHHPLETHGAHNGATKATGVLKDIYWLRKTVLYPLFFPLELLLGQQDPYELRYRSYRRALYDLFREQPIDAFVSGHDHSLQHVRIDHPGVGHQIVSGAGANRSPVQRYGLDLLWLNRLGRLVGLGDALPAPRHELEFGLGGEIEAEDLSGYGFAVVTVDPSADEAQGAALVVDYVDPWREGPLHTSRIEHPPPAR